MTKISQLPQDTTPAINDLMAIVDAANTITKRITMSDLATIMNSLLNAPGDVKHTAAAAIPNGWLLCDGSAISRSAFANLYAAIGTTYGTGDGTTTFNIPNAKGRSAFGLDTSQTEFNTLGKTGGQTGLMAHSHLDPTTPGGAAGAGYELPTSTFSSYDYVGAAPTSTTGSGVNNLNPYIVFNWIIKT